MTKEQIAARRDELIAQDGPWIAHHIHLGEGVYTMPQLDPKAKTPRMDYFVDLARLLLGDDLCEKSALDLGSNEGGIAIRLAQEGFGKVVGLEIRDEHLRKSEFAREALGLTSVEFVKGDMLRIGEALGDTRFDLIVCAGVLYHIDAPDILPFLKSLAQHSRVGTVIDTHVALEATEMYQAQPGLEVYGHSVSEHRPKDDRKTKAGALWASWENVMSFWPTERSLANLLIAAGFSLVTRPIAPSFNWPWQDRGIWLAYSPDGFGVRSSSFPRFLPEPDPRPKHQPGREEEREGVRNPHTSRLSECE